MSTYLDKNQNALIDALTCFLSLQYTNFYKLLRQTYFKMDKL